MEKVNNLKCKSSLSFKKLDRVSPLKKIRRHWQLYLIILLPLLYIIIFKYVPMYGVQIAFKNFRVSKGIFGSEWVGLEHFIIFFTSPSSLKIIMNTLVISIYGIAAGFPFAILLALALNETSSQLYKKSVQMITYAPYFISTVVLVALLLQVLDSRNGIISQILVVLGGKPQNLLGNPSLFKSIFVWSGVWQTTGYSAIIYLAALSSINVELYDASKIDGASKLQKVWHIDLPGIAPTIIILLIMNLGYAMSVGFEKVYLMQNPLNLETSEVISTFVYRVGLLQNNYGFSTAVNLFNSVVNLILLSVVNLFAKKFGETSLW